VSVDPAYTVKDARPSPTVLRIANPVIRCTLHTPLARAVKTLAVIEFAGRRTGRCRRVVVGWHLLDGSPVVLTPAPWRVNFTAPALATVRWRGRQADYVGTLTTDPGIVAAAVNTLLDNGTSSRSLALGVPREHVVTIQDIIDTDRAMIRFDPAAAAHVGEGRALGKVVVVPG